VGASLAVMVVFFRFWGNGYVYFEDVYYHMFIMADFLPS
jgi:hypothetical protein